MLWFGGSIAEAVNLSKQRNAIFVVFVEGDNELSTEMANTLNDDTVSKILSEKANFLTIKLKSGSVDYTHFAQIYQFVPVPSLFFIGRNGTPLEVVCAGVPADNLTARIDRILEEHRKLTPQLVQPSSSSHNVQNATANFLKAESGQTADKKAQDILNKNDTIETSQPITIINIMAADNDAVNGSNTSDSLEKANEINAVSEKQQNDTNDVQNTDSVEKELRVLDKPIHQVAESMSTTESSSSQPIPPQGEVLRSETAGKPQRARDESSEPSMGPSAKIQKTEHTPPEGQQYEVVCTGDVCERRPIQVDEEKMEHSAVKPTSSEDGNKELEEKLKRTKELIEAKRREKEEQEKELERKREIERRQAGQGVAELRRWQQDQEMKQLQEERKREKQEEAAARQRVLQQIAQDRAERAARAASPSVTQQPAAQPTAAVAADGPATLHATSTSGDVSQRARIQFKLSDGTSHTAQFPADTRLADVRQYVVDNLQLERSSFALWTMFPRAELTADEETLLGLHLAPSAALLVLPTRAAATGPPASTALGLDLITDFITKLFTSFILMPTQQVWNYIRGRLFPDRAVPRVTADEGRPPAAPGLRYRPRTNIHRLTGDPGDDDNNTWNGNSTQQM